MPSVDFYILASHQPQHRLQLAYRLIHKAYQQRHRVYIQAENEMQAQHLDDTLWLETVSLFLPHAREDQNPHPATPVRIGYGALTTTENDILLNLSPEIPLFYAQFKRILEIGNQHPEQIGYLRQHYRFYQQQGYPIHHHPLS